MMVGQVQIDETEQRFLNQIEELGKHNQAYIDLESEVRASWSKIPENFRKDLIQDVRGILGRIRDARTPIMVDLERTNRALMSYRTSKILEKHDAAASKLIALVRNHKA